MRQQINNTRQRQRVMQSDSAINGRFVQWLRRHRQFQCLVLVRGLLALSLLVGLGPVSAATITVFGAASLTNAFNKLAEQFMLEHPEHQVVNSFAASDVLLQQIINGAPADVFASADERAMDQAQAEGVVEPESRQVFATNEVVLIVPQQQPQIVHSLDDLRDPQVQRVAYGNPRSVPVGRYTEQGLRAIDLWALVQERGIMGQNVRQVLDYVARGEVDAGFVFSTDARQKGDAVTVVEALALSEPVRYPIALVTQPKQSAHQYSRSSTAAQTSQSSSASSASQPSQSSVHTEQSDQALAAAQFLQFVLSESGQAILAQFGFGAAQAGPVHKSVPAQDRQ